MTGAAFYIGANAAGDQPQLLDDAVDGGDRPFSRSEGCHDQPGASRWSNRLPLAERRWVFGVEAQGDWADLRVPTPAWLSPDRPIAPRSTHSACFTGQSATPVNNALLYVKGGAAITDSRFNTIDTAMASLQRAPGDQTRWGGTFGVGLEYGFARTGGRRRIRHLFCRIRLTPFTTPAGALLQTDRIGSGTSISSRRGVNYRWVARRPKVLISI